ncbi:allantoicase [Denitratisoma sp. agr-D3]
MENTLIAPAADLPEWAKRAVNLADPRIGAEALACSDDFFAAKERLLQPQAAVFITGKYDDNGKWMDGWESRRKRGPGHDWCVVKLGRPGTLVGFDIDTSFFTGNYPPAASIDGCPEGADPARDESWQPLLAPTALAGNSHHLLAVDDARIFSHVRLNIFPDGGVARLRVFGQPAATTVSAGADGLVDLVALVHGGRAIAWNDAHFGVCTNLLLPGRGINMGEGWETRRRREPGHDWCILALGVPGRVRRVEVDTAHFKGNFPDRCSIQGAWLPGVAEASLVTQSQFWAPLLPESKLSADAIQHFDALTELGPITHVRFNLHPDGGVSRLRLWGEPGQ